jgi:hypothetical protein
VAQPAADTHALPEVGINLCGARFLIDQCLSIDLAAVAAEAGFEAQHVARVGKAGWQDWNVLRYANVGDFVLSCGQWVT